jgi:hypothetical protein
MAIKVNIFMKIKELLYGITEQQGMEPPPVPQPEPKPLVVQQTQQQQLQPQEEEHDESGQKIQKQQ